MSKVDIIIPAYNAHNTLAAALDSIVIQTMKDDIQVIVINDCSSNGGYAEIIKNYTDKLNIIELTHEVNKGCGATRNTGLDYSKSDYIMFVDADDKLKNENSVETLYNIISKNSELNVIYSPITCITDGEVTGEIPATHSIWIFSSIFNKKFLDKYNIRFSNTSSGEDGGFNKKVKILSRPDQVGYIDQSIYLWTDANKEGRINNDFFIKYTGRIGYAENLNEAYNFLETKKEFIPASFDDLTIDYLANIVSIYFLYVLMESYENPLGKDLIEVFKPYYKKYSKIYNQNVTIEKYELVYQANYYNHFKSEMMPLDNKISFEDYILLLSEGENTLIIPKREKPILSIIVPLYNGEKTLDKLMQSIINQGLTKDYYEVIFANDNSTDNSIQVLDKYKNLCNIKIISTSSERKFHAPGFSRKDGFAAASGKWITFIDNDDYFISNSFEYIYHNFAKDDMPVIFTNFIEIDKETKQLVENNYDKNLFLHGKFYNKKFLDNFNINFSDSLMTHEDVYFNNQVISALNEYNLEATYIDINTYVWVKTPETLSRKNYSEENCYVDVHFKDYLEASFPYVQGIISYKNKELNYQKIFEYILKGYFYYQQLLWKKGNNNCQVKTNYCILQNYIQYIKQECNILNEDIINYIYSNPKKYMDIKNYCIYNSCVFVETTSFIDFIINLGDE